MKENFDDIIKRRWDERQFPVDEIHRQDMANLLEGDKKRRGFIFWWLGSVAVVSLVAGYLIWMNSLSLDVDENATLPPFDIAQEPLRSKTETENAAFPRRSETEDEKMKTELKTGTLPTQTSVEGNIETNSSMNEKAGADEIVSNKPINYNEIAIQNKNVVNQNSSTGKNDSTTQTKAASNKNEKINTLQKQKPNIPKGQSPEKAITQQQKNENAADEIPKDGYKVELDNPNQATITSKEAAIRVFPDSLEYDPWTNAIYRDGTVRSLNITKPIDDLNISEVENLNKPAPGEIKPHTKMTHPVYFIVETGMGLVLASKPYYDGGIKFNVGGGLGMKLAPKVHLQLTGGYQMQDGGFDFQKASTVNTLGFGLRSQFNTLRPDRLHFIYGKLGAAYRFGRSTLDSHFGVQWLYGSQGNITRQEQSQVPPGHTETTEYAWLNTNGLRKTQWWWDVSYGYMIFPKFYIHGGASYYFTSLTETDTPANDYSWKGKSATVQPFVTIKYLLHANF
ncbi:MAG TPA: hypothetical protein VFV79_07515 [Saprospiraceae bacterium]|nr:hypothetical protein [Saprospiraceae bacterium]